MPCQPGIKYRMVHFFPKLRAAAVQQVVNAAVFFGSLVQLDNRHPFFRCNLPENIPGRDNGKSCFFQLPAYTGLSAAQIACNCNVHNALSSFSPCLSQACQALLSPYFMALRSIRQYIISQARSGFGKRQEIPSSSCIISSYLVQI